MNNFVSKWLMKPVIWILFALLVVFNIVKFKSGHLFAPSVSFGGGYQIPNVLIILGISIIFLLIGAVIYQLSNRFAGPIRAILLVLVFSVLVLAWFFVPFAAIFDSATVNAQVYELLAHPQNGWSSYFQRFGNNVPIVNFLYVMDWPLKKILLPDSGANMYAWHALIGQIGVLVTLYGSARIVDLITGKKSGGNFLLFAGLLFPTFTIQFGQIAYSDTLAMPFMVIGVWQVLGQFNHKGMSGKELVGLLVGSFAIAVSFYLRPNIVVIIVALLAGLFLTKISEWRKILVLIVLIFTVTLGVGKIGNAVSEQTGYEASQTDKMPIESWFLTAYYAGGRNGQAINEITDKYQSYDQKKSYIQTKLKDRIKQLGVPGVIRLWRDKLNILFGFNSDFGMVYFNQFRNNAKYNNFKPFFKVVIVMSLSTMALLYILSMFSLRIGKNSQENHYALVVSGISFIGMTMFYVLLWEVQEHYMYLMLPFLMILGSVGVANLVSFLVNKFQIKGSLNANKRNKN